MRVKGIILLLALALLPVVFVSADRLNSPEPTVLQVTRSSHLDNFPPLVRTVRDANQVQYLYTAAYALPKVSRGIEYCPIDVGIVYHLSFLRSTTQIQQMEMDTGGCAWLRLSENDFRYPTNTFLTLFAKTIGVPLSILAPVPH